MSLAFQDIKIDDVCQVGDGAHATIKREESGVLYLSSRNFKDGRLDLSKTFYISEEDFARHFKEGSKALTKTQTGDVALSIIGTIGEPYVVKPSDRFGLSSAVAFMRPDPDRVDSEYLYYWLKGPEFQQAVYAVKSGVAQGYVSLEMMRRLPFRNFSLDVQQRLASTLKAYDNLIENNNRRIAILEDMAQSLYREWFVKFRFPGHEGCQFKDSPLGRIPEGWGVVALEDISERITDGAHKSPKSVESGVAMASVKDMHDFGFNLDRCRQISEADYLELERQDSVVKANDILVAKDGSYLKHTFVVEKDLKVALLSSIAMIRSNERVKPHWLAYCLRSDIVKARMKQCVSGVAIPRIILKDFRKFKIYLPSDELMNEWNILVQPMIGECWNLIAKNNNLKAQRDMLLPKLMSGKIGI